MYLRATKIGNTISGGRIRRISYNEGEGAKLALRSAAPKEPEFPLRETETTLACAARNESRRLLAANVCVRAAAAGPESRVRLSSSCAHENRAGVFECALMVDKSVSCGRFESG